MAGFRDHETVSGPREVTGSTFYDGFMADRQQGCYSAYEQTLSKKKLPSGYS